MRRVVMGLWLVIVLIASMAAGMTVVPTAVAQDATPAVDRVTPDPAGCQVEPRSIESLTAYVVTATPMAATPSLATPALVVPSEGEPADAETVAGVTATAEELFACYNAGDLLRVFALFTDDYLMRAFAEDGITEEALGFFSRPPEARPAEAWESIAVQDVHVLADGRIGAYLLGHNPEGEGVDFVDYTIFVEQDGRYLIDDVIFLDPDSDSD